MVRSILIVGLVAGLLASISAGSLIWLVRMNQGNDEYVDSPMDEEPELENEELVLVGGPGSEADEKQHAETVSPRQEPNRPTFTESAGSENPVLTRWSAIADESGNPASSQFEIRSVTFTQNSSRLLTHSESEIACWTLATRKPVSRFLISANRPGYVSPTGESVTLLNEDPSGLAVHAATGERIGVARLLNGGHFGRAAEFGGYTPGGGFVVFYDHNHRDAALVAVDARAGGGRKLSTPISTPFHFSSLVPMARGSVLFVLPPSNKVDKSPSQIVMLDLNSGERRPLTSCTITPAVQGSFRPLQVSPDESLVALTDRNSVQVCDWRKNRRVLSYSEQILTVGPVCFTPDGNRMLIARVPDTTGKRPIHGNPTVDLYDLKANALIGRFEPGKYRLNTVSALATSHDGSWIALASGAEIVILDFQRAFGPAPLPPLPPNAEPEVVPVR